MKGRKQAIKSSSESDSDDDSILNETFNGYSRPAEPKNPKIFDELMKPHNDPFSPRNPSLLETFIEFRQENKQKELKDANASIYAFGKMIVSTICSMQPRNQIKAMQQATDIIMKIKLNEE